LFVLDDDLAEIVVQQHVFGLWFVWFHFLPSTEQGPVTALRNSRREQFPAGFGFN
jgi:hypothetical protein